MPIFNILLKRISFIYNMNQVRGLKYIKITLKISLISKTNFVTNSSFKESNKLTLCVLLETILMFLRASEIFSLFNKWILIN